MKRDPGLKVGRTFSFRRHLCKAGTRRALNRWLQDRRSRWPESLRL